MIQREGLRAELTYIHRAIGAEADDPVVPRLCDPSEPRWNPVSAMLDVVDAEIILADTAPADVWLPRFVGDVLQRRNTSPLYRSRASEPKVLSLQSRMSSSSAAAGLDRRNSATLGFLRWPALSGSLGSPRVELLHQLPRILRSIDRDEVAAGDLREAPCGDFL